MKSDNERKDPGNRNEEEDLNVFVSDLLHQMTTKFDYMGNQIMLRMDDMGNRINALEKSIGDLLEQQGVTEPVSVYDSSLKKREQNRLAHDKSKGNF